MQCSFGDAISFRVLFCLRLFLCVLEATLYDISCLLFISIYLVRMLRKIGTEHTDSGLEVTYGFKLAYILFVLEMEAMTATTSPGFDIT